MNEKCKYCGATETDHSIGGWGCQRRGLINGLDAMAKERDAWRGIVAITEAQINTLLLRIQEDMRAAECVARKEKS